MEIFLDIETIPSQQSWVREYVAEKTTPPANIKKQESIDAWYAEKHADAVEDAMNKCSFDGAMNQIICIGAAFGDEDPVSFYEPENEKQCLFDFYKWLVEKTGMHGRHNTGSGVTFVGHNVTGFDLRVIRQRSIVLGVKPSPGIPFDAKPWDKNPFDTMVQWDGKNMTSLDKIAKAFGIEGKGDIDGSQVYGYWKTGKHEEIAEYCRDDVRMVREVYKKMRKVI